MAFHEVRFPDAISRGARGGPERRTQIVELASGDEERNASWANSRRRYDVAYGQIAIGFNAYLFGGGVEIYAGAGAFSTVPSGYSSEWVVPPGAVLPYVVGSCGVHLHGEILGGLVSASGWADLDLRGPVPVYYEGSLGLEGCVLWVLCASVELRVGLNSGGFYVA
jgi:hypothetical protein